MSHLYTPASKYYGALIGNASGTVARVSVEASSVSGDNSAAAVVASLAGSAAVVRECSAGEDVRVSAEMAGGVVRAVTGGATVADCYSRATVTGGTYYLPSGVVNYLYNGTVKDCYFAGSAAAPWWARAAAG